MRLVVAGFAVAFATGQSLAAQGAVVVLRVVDSASTAPIADVRVAIAGVRTEGRTDANGRFVYSAPRPGRVEFVLLRLGFAPGTVSADAVAGDTTHIGFGMTAAPHSLTAVTVRDSATRTPFSLRGFERRSADRLGGAYITRMDIEKRRPIQTTDLLRRIASIQLRDSSGVTLAVSGRMQKLVSRATPGGPVLEIVDCVLQVAVDGSFKPWGFDVNSIPPEQIHGIEVYPGASSVPSEYAALRRDSHCGAILVWTRIGQ
jgi:hypothetical protein